MTPPNLRVCAEDRPKVALDAGDPNAEDFDVLQPDHPKVSEISHVAEALAIVLPRGKPETDRFPWPALRRWAHTKKAVSPSAVVIANRVRGRILDAGRGFGLRLRLARSPAPKRSKRFARPRLRPTVL